MDNKIEIFRNEEFGEIRTFMIDNQPWFAGKDITNILGYSNASKALKDHVSEEDKLNNESLSSLGQRGGWIINESGLYSLIFSSKLESSKRFKRWVTSDVLPTIRKTGGYVNDDTLFINTYLPFADDQTKMLFSATLQTIRNQNQIIESQKDEIEYKQEVINGLTDDIDVYTKRNVINRICRRRSENYATRYTELYKCFKENFHIDLNARCEGYNKKQQKKKDKLTTIGYAEKFGYIDDLYSCCTKLFEAEIDEVLDQINSIHSNK